MAKVKSGMALSSPNGAGTRDNGAPSKRTPNYKRTRKNPPGDMNEDTGDIKKSKDFKGLMGTLKKGHR